MEAKWREISPNTWDFYISEVEWGVVFRRGEKFHFFTRFPSKPKKFESLFEAQSFVEELVFNRLEEMIEAVRKVMVNKRDEK